MNIKWNYDRKFNQYWTSGMERRFSIDKEDGLCKLTEDHFRVIGRFKKMSSAKAVVELLING